MTEQMINGIGLNLTSLPDGRMDLLPAMLRTWADLGCSHVEVTARRLDLVVAGQLDHARTEAVAKAVADAGLKPVLHANHAINLMDLTYPDTHWDVAVASVEACAILGAQSMVLHSGHLPNGAFADHGAAAMAAEREAFRRLGDLAGAAGVRLAVENLIPQQDRHAYGANPRALAEQIASTDHPAVGVCLAFGHAWLAATLLGFDYIPALAQLSPFVWHLHLHDNCGRPDKAGDAGDAASLGFGDMHAPIFDGTIPWEDLLPRLTLRPGTFGGIELNGRYNARAGEIVAAAKGFAAYFNSGAALPARPNRKAL
jgi:sugar phosphate isomerase/epimerase